MTSPSPPVPAANVPSMHGLALSAICALTRSSPNYPQMTRVVLIDSTDEHDPSSTPGVSLFHTRCILIPYQVCLSIPDVPFIPGVSFFHTRCILYPYEVCPSITWCILYPFQVYPSTPGVSFIHARRILHPYQAYPSSIPLSCCSLSPLTMPSDQQHVASGRPVQHQPGQCVVAATRQGSRCAGVHQI